MSCQHENTVDAIDTSNRTTRTCSDCKHRFVCLHCNDTHTMTLRDQRVPCTHCPLPCGKCRLRGIGAFCARTPCNCDCHDRRQYGHWNGMCPARKHGLDWKGQKCNLCESETP
jgi:hypothetical protein